ncbi:MAG TPA: hypothetical protein VG276_05155 [Actinomycetes bacterium]|nr:hypothetical protein [Actinomycetes bacterium]
MGGSQDPPPEPMRHVFDELEAEFEAGLRREAEQETVAALRAQVGATPMWEQLARRIGVEGVVRAGARLVRGTVIASYPDFFVLQGRDDAQHLVRPEATSIALPPEPIPPQPAPSAAARRYTLSLALRELARRREPVRLELIDGNAVAGTVEAVGSDYVEVAEHDIGEARRETAVRARRLTALAAVALVTLLPDR